MSAEFVGGQSWVLQSQSVLFQCVSASRASALPETLAHRGNKGRGSDNAFRNACGSHAPVVGVYSSRAGKSQKHDGLLQRRLLEMPCRRNSQSGSNQYVSTGI